MSENIVFFSGKESNTYNKPKMERWNNIKIGSKIHIMTEDEIIENYGAMNNAPGVQFFASQIPEIEEKYLGKKFTVNKTLKERIEYATREKTCLYQPVIDYSRAYFPLSLFMVDDEGVENFPKPKEDVKLVKYNIKIKDKKEEIINEMISKVNKETFKQLLSLGMSSFQTASDKAVDAYLRTWAEQKYEYYMMFNRNLFIKKDISFSVTKDAMTRMVDTLLSNYEVYNIILRIFKTEDFINNVCPKNGILEEFCETYKPGMKLSKFLSKYLNDVKFDIDYSKVLQDKSTKTSLFISIDPCDFMTVSINKHNWKSCHNAADGLYRTAPYSLMLDEASLVGFVSKGTMCDYDIKGHTFQWNSKQARVMVNIDKNTGALSFNKPYPSMCDEAQKEVRLFMEETMSKYLGISNKWNVQQGSNNCYVQPHGDYHYTDPLYFVAIHETMDTQRTNDIQFDIGSTSLYCLDCGKRMSASGAKVKSDNFVCDHCRSNLIQRVSA